MWKWIQSLFGGGADVTSLLEGGSAVIDVRTPSEYASGHARGSVNIPLQVLPQRLEEIRKMQGPVVTCCRSGMRSGAAVRALRKAGIEAVNGGSWQQVQHKISQS